MKKVLIVIAALLISTSAIAETTSGNYSIGLGPMGNFFLVKTNPELWPGAGGHIFFDYRWSPQFSTRVTVSVTAQNGKGISEGDDEIVFLGVPTFDVKFYFLSEASRWDPYAILGFGIFVLTEGSNDDGTVAVGMGADVGIGCDFYMTEKWSLGLETIFRAIGMVDSGGGSDNGRALFPLSLNLNVAYHF